MSATVAVSQQMCCTTTVLACGGCAKSVVPQEHRGGVQSVSGFGASSCGGGSKYPRNFSLPPWYPRNTSYGATDFARSTNAKAPKHQQLSRHGKPSDEC